MKFQKHALEINNAAIAAVQPLTLMKKNLFIDDKGLHVCSHILGVSAINKLIVIAAGKAASAMAVQAEEQLCELITDGICITKYNHSIPLKKIKTIEAAHPVPDYNSVLAGNKVMELIKNLSPKDIVLVLLSGGASSLLTDIPENCSLQNLQDTNELLVKSGASIEEINIVRKHLSNIKGGQLAKAAQPAKIYTLIISDVVGDDLSSIASGPTVADQSTYSDALEILKKYNVWQTIPVTIRMIIEKGLEGLLTETPNQADEFFQNTFTRIIGNNLIALQAAKEKADELGYHSIILNKNFTGNTEILSRKFAKDLLLCNNAIPTCFLMGGETTLSVSGNGKGGRNQHFALCALDELNKYINEDSKKNITILSAGTDGTDGPTDAAGAIIDNELIHSDLINDELIKKHLINFDAYHFFEKINCLIKTGPTQTNVMDIMIGLVNKKNPD